MLFLSNREMCHIIVQATKTWAIHFQNFEIPMTSNDYDEWEKFYSRIRDYSEESYSKMVSIVMNNGGLYFNSETELNDFLKRTKPKKLEGVEIEIISPTGDPKNE